MSRWLRTLSAPQTGPLVFLVPPAGAGPRVFSSWLPHAGQFELVAVEAPGRERRYGEPAAHTVDSLVEPITSAIAARAHGQYLLFGHSAGALLAREVAERLAAEGMPPSLLVVAGSPPPHLVTGKLSAATDAELIHQLREWGGTPEAVLSEPELLAVFLPCLRADLAVAESCRRDVSPHPVDLPNVPIVVLSGTQDRSAPPELSATWSAWTTAHTQTYVVPGTHFFPISSPATVLDIITQEWHTHSRSTGDCASPS